MQYRDQPDVDVGIAVQDMTELMGHHTLQFIAREVIDGALIDTDDRVVGGEPGGKRVDAGFGNDVNGWYRNARSDGHLFNDVQQPALAAVCGVVVDLTTAECFGDAAPAAADGAVFEKTGGGDRADDSEARPDPYVHWQVGD